MRHGIPTVNITIGVSLDGRSGGAASVIQVLVLDADAGVRNGGAGACTAGTGHGGVVMVFFVLLLLFMLVVLIFCQ